MKNNLAEYQVVRKWQELAASGAVLVTESGEPLRVIYPGRLNDNRGADFRDAVLAIGNGLVLGEIEVHVRSSDWQTHGHHQDPYYNQVVLHVVMWEDGALPARSLNGEMVPTISIDKYLEAKLHRQRLVAEERAPGSSMPCYKIAEYQPERVAQFLDTAGEQRFRDKAARFQRDAGRMDDGQSLYKGIMGALGYAKNKLPCLALAERIPLSYLESLVEGELHTEDGLVRVQALLLGTAGLLPSQHPVIFGESHRDEYIGTLERRWTDYPRTDAMSCRDWNLFKVRPNNSPVRRIVAMSYLLWRYREKGLLASLLELVKETPLEQSRRLAEALLITASGYWAEYIDFGLACPGLTAALLGLDRASEIIVNVLLPLVYARQASLQEKALEIYRVYPRLAANAIEKHLRIQLGLDGKLVNSACRQQGLLHLYHTRCTQGKCHECLVF